MQGAGRSLLPAAGRSRGTVSLCLRPQSPGCGQVVFGILAVRTLRWSKQAERNPAQVQRMTEKEHEFTSMIEFRTEKTTKNGLSLCFILV